jgi:hypothetical protein
MDPNVISSRSPSARLPHSSLSRWTAAALVKIELDDRLPLELENVNRLPLELENVNRLPPLQLLPRRLLRIHPEMEDGHPVMAPNCFQHQFVFSRFSLSLQINLGRILLIIPLRSTGVNDVS